MVSLFVCVCLWFIIRYGKSLPLPFRSLFPSISSPPRPFPFHTKIWSHRTPFLLCLLLFPCPLVTVPFPVERQPLPVWREPHWTRICQQCESLRTAENYTPGDLMRRQMFTFCWIESSIPVVGWRPVALCTSLLATTQRNTRITGNEVMISAIAFF